MIDSSSVMTMTAGLMKRIAATTNGKLKGAGLTMKIVRHGMIPDDGIRQFKCPKCGCIFEADRTEYRYSFYGNYLALKCDCPEEGCGCKVCREVEE